MHIFFAPDISDDLATLNQEESHHCVKVLRMQKDQEVMVTDGFGSWCKAVVRLPHPKATQLVITERTEAYGKRTFHLHMAVAPTKNIDRFEWFLEKSTECGIDEITPVYCRQSERRTIKPHRLEKIVMAAMKQSLRAYLPRLNPAVAFNDFMQRPAVSNAFIAHCAEGEKPLLQEVCSPGKATTLLVGPEGDFTMEEVAAAKETGFREISMGQHRLRTETAAMALCVQANTINGLL